MEYQGEIYQCSARGNLKISKIYVGDRVEFSDDLISKVYSRKNQLIRPPVANVDKLFIVIAPKPEPDFFVIDKMLLFAFVNNIEPIIVVNKIDISNELFEKVKTIYQNVCQTLCVSAVNGYNIDELKNHMIGSISAFAGQSAVGKSTLSNCILPGINLDVGDLSKRIERGKNTTTHCKLFCFDNNSYFIDTPGFSLIDEYYLPISYDQLPSYYPDYVKLASQCKFNNSCTHIHEKDCSVISALNSGKIDKERYERYLQIFEGLKKRWKNEHR